MKLKAQQCKHIETSNDSKQKQMIAKFTGRGQNARKKGNNYSGNCTTILAEGSILLQQHFNWLAL